jgi:hypothetical protein
MAKAHMPQSLVCSFATRWLSCTHWELQEVSICVKHHPDELSLQQLIKIVGGWVALQRDGPIGLNTGYLKPCVRQPG